MPPRPWASAVRLADGHNGSGERPTVDMVVLRAHEGNPRAALEEVVAAIVTPESRVLVTGRRFREFVALPSLTEPEAVEHALCFVVNGVQSHRVPVICFGRHLHCAGELLGFRHVGVDIQRGQDDALGDQVLAGQGVEVRGNGVR
jgi:hypothetical protein